MATLNNMPTFLTRLLRPFSTSTSLGLNPASESAAVNIPAGAQKCTIAAGCFWGVEKIFRKHFSASDAEKGIYDTKVGYIGGDSSHPSYRAVCTGRTGHAEALQIIYNPEKVTYKSLIEFFYKMHDPTTPNRQGMDTGTQYRSAIFWHDEEQEKIAKEVTKKVGEKWWTKGTVSTEIIKAGQWWDAEEYHQVYLDKNPGGYECPAHYVRKFPDLD